MKKVILLSTVLGLGALGMACGESANVSVNVNKPANAVLVNAATPAPVNTATPATNVTAPNANAPKANVPAANAPKGNVPAPTATKKP